MSLKKVIISAGVPILLASACGSQYLKNSNVSQSRSTLPSLMDAWIKTNNQSALAALQEELKISDRCLQRSNIQARIYEANTDDAGIDQFALLVADSGTVSVDVDDTGTIIGDESGMARRIDLADEVNINEVVTLMVESADLCDSPSEAVESAKEAILTFISGRLRSLGGEMYLVDRSGADTIVFMYKNRNGYNEIIQLGHFPSGTYRAASNVSTRTMNFDCVSQSGLTRLRTDLVRFEITQRSGRRHHTVLRYGKLTKVLIEESSPGSVYIESAKGLVAGPTRLKSNDFKVLIG